MESDMGLREKFNESLKEAMKAKNPRRVSTLRLVLAAVKDRDIAGRTEESKAGISDDDILSVLAKMIKQREESAEVYQANARPELATAEREEIAIIREFQPAQLSDAEIAAAVAKAVAETGAASMKDMGKVMGALKTAYTGQMDFGKAGAAVKAALTPKA
jgi:hypothetical protein